MATAVLLSLHLTKVLADVSSLDNINVNQDNINPLNDPDQDLTNNDQDKRTICGALNGFKCGGKLSKHITYKNKPAYAYTALRPVVLRPSGYRYTKPKVPLSVPSSTAIKPTLSGWKPVLTPTKPAVLTPSNHVDVIHNNPVPHVDHVQTAGTPGHAHLHPGHVHLQPAHVHIQPVAIQGAHFDQVHQVHYPHGNHYDTLTHVDHVHQVPAAPVVPVAPAPTPVHVVKPFIPSPVLFEVTKPNLGVLPFGARFQTSVLREVPHLHFRPAVPAVPVAPAPVALPVPFTPAFAPVPVRPAGIPVPVPHPSVIPTPVLPAPTPVFPQPAVQGVLQTPVGLPTFAPQPGVSVEYHGTRNYLPFGGAFPVLPPHTPVHAVRPTIATNPALQLPYAHPNHGFVAQQQLPHDHQAQFVAQQLPHEQQGHFLPQQRLPLDAVSQFFQNQQQIQQYQDIPQQQLPLEDEQEQYVSNNLNVQTFDQSNVIQPGQSDLQIPYHLPQHQGWDASVYQQNALAEESTALSDFRPSAGLEPPYVK